MTEIGYIDSIQGECASVVFQRKSACGGNCGSCKGGCESASHVTEIQNTIGANKGDRVRVSIEEKTFNKMVLLVYVFPLVMMVLGIGIGTVVFKGAGYANYEMFSFLLGMMLLTVSYLILNVLSRKNEKNKKQLLRMVEIIRD
ncbi:SoxR reducing system RseC family protein [Clostridium sp. ZS2-4]|uniref:SoxR reducing system RseC family protein n=1 Tax=Clostridium sp. ZS2-4 TaxID=2987703 RepID=UPI00227C48CA|nr:SoxR reducing system RseC family protein [Clostridium sp. ZS2-4]MCY6355762.1 SoxR reducing system RseC family protein [Clostridium sp. ZS2-4]